MKMPVCFYVLCTVNFPCVVYTKSVHVCDHSIVLNKEEKGVEIEI